MPRLAPLALAASLASAAFTCAAADAPDGGRLAAEQGCLNCHSARVNYGAPSFASMGERAAQGTRAPEWLVDHWFEEMREKDVHTHNFVSDARAKAVLSWVAHGAK